MLRQLGAVAALVLANWVGGPAAAAADARAPSQEVRFTSAGAQLAGTMVIPPQIIAAAVVVHGSGQQARMVPFAGELAEHGIAALTYDKRGVGESGGTYVGGEVGTNNASAANLELLAADAAAAVDELIRRLEPRRAVVGLVGFSQAGWIIPLAAVRNPRVRFIVLWSGPVVTTHEQLRFQFYTDNKDDFWDSHTEAEVREHVSADAERFEFADTDPRVALAHLSIPGLWLFGARDVLVPVQLSIERLQPLKAQGKQFEYRLFPGMGHQLDEDHVLPAMLEWLNAAQLRPRSPG